MLYRYSEVFRTSLLLVDLLLVASSWLAAYSIRFYTVFDAPLGVPLFEAYLPPLALILPLWFVLFRSRGLYEPQRTGSLFGEIGRVVGATAFGVMALVAITFFYRSYFYSRGVILIFFVLATMSVTTFRLIGRLALRSFRRRGFNLRYALVVGAGQLAEELIDRVHGHPEVGMRVRGVLAQSTPGSRRTVRDVPVIGDYGQLKDILRRSRFRDRIDQVFLALPRDDGHNLEKVLSDLEDEMVTVRLVPDLLHVRTLRSSVEDFDGLVVISLRDSPLVGWAAVSKRVFDVVVAGTALVVVSPMLAVITVATLVSSGRPVFFVQERMGLDGRVFRMIKFRTMMRDAEKATGPVWTRREDDRRTGLGALLRRMSFDELPQLWNVLRGDMSLVGPRPERPVFIEQFRAEVPGYMLRHKVKAGLTGWAQVCGWRGDTSLHERIEHDIYYIQNWSLALDIRILLLTVWRGWFGPSAY
jgi:Undecaprenyl-phosphate glucose phosphotransferase